MHVERPEKPQGRHVSLLRDHLGISQTLFGALLETTQTTVSQWEHVHKRDDYLPGHLAEPFLEIWDCFPTRPTGGFTEIMAVLAAYRMRKAAPQAAPSKADTKPIRMVPEEPVAAVTPEIYWVPGESSAPPGEDSAAEPPTKESGGSNVASKEVMRFHLSVFTLSILFAVWSRARKHPGATSSLWQGRFNGWATALVVLLVIPLGCFHAFRTPPGRRVPVPIPGQVYADKAKPASQAMGNTPKQSIKMPDAPYSWQKLAPCDPGEVEKKGGCWFKGAEAPPCPEVAVEEAGICYVPIPARPKPSNTVGPEQK